MAPELPQLPRSIGGGRGSAPELPQLPRSLGGAGAVHQSCHSCKPPSTQQSWAPGQGPSTKRPHICNSFLLMHGHIRLMTETGHQVPSA